MINLKNSFFAIGILASSFFFTSCDKASVDNLSNNTTTATDYSSLLGIMDLSEIDDATTEDGLKSATELDYLPCFERIIHENENLEFWPRSWTFSFTNPDCVDYFGNTKSGSVNVTLTGFWKAESSLRTITYDNFSINGNKLEGTRTILNTGLNEDLNLTFERNFLNASYSKGDTATITWESMRNVEMVAGILTPIGADDEYLVTGGASGLNFDGKAFTVSVSDELHYKRCSFFPVSGNVTVEVEGESTLYINYGDGDCDKIAEMTVDDVTTEITLGLNN